MIVCAGLGTEPTISWNRAGITITNGSNDRVNVYNELGVQRGIRYIQSILEICSAKTSDEGLYECVLTSRTISKTANFTLSVNSAPAAVIIGPSDSYPVINSSLFLTCVASGYPLPTVTWYRDWEEVIDADNIQSEVIEQNGENYVQSTLLLCSVQETAVYNCSVSNNIYGNVVTSVSATVVVQGMYLHDLVILLLVSFL